MENKSEEMENKEEGVAETKSFRMNCPWSLERPSHRESRVQNYRPWIVLDCYQNCGREVPDQTFALE